MVQSSLAASPAKVTVTADLSASPSTFGESSGSFKKVIVGSALVYLLAVMLALTLHVYAVNEKAIADEVLQCEQEITELIFKRAEHSPRMIQLLQWPEGARDNGIDSYLERCRELEPMVSAELLKARQTYERTRSVASHIPAGNSNRPRIVLLEQLSAEDAHLYQLFAREMDAAKLSESLPPAARSDYINNQLGLLSEEESSVIVSRGKIIEQLWPK